MGLKADHSRKKIFNKKSTLIWPNNASTKARTKLVVTDNALFKMSALNVAK